MASDASTCEDCREAGSMRLCRDGGELFANGKASREGKLRATK